MLKLISMTKVSPEFSVKDHIINCMSNINNIYLGNVMKTECNIKFTFVIWLSVYVPIAW